MTKPQAVMNAGDPEQVKAAAERQRDRADLEKEDLLVLLASPAGKRFLIKILGACNVWDVGHYEAGLMTYMKGARDIGTTLLREILLADPKAYFELAKIEKQG
jgi:hypothetical protein